MASCLMAPSHFLNQCSLIISESVPAAIIWWQFQMKYSRYLFFSDMNSKSLIQDYNHTDQGPMSSRTGQDDLISNTIYDTFYPVSWSPSHSKLMSWRSNQKKSHLVLIQKVIIHFYYNSVYHEHFGAITCMKLWIKLIIVPVKAKTDFNWICILSKQRVSEKIWVSGHLF